MNNQTVTNSAFTSKFIRAGAGAGKTTTLIKTFFDFVQQYKLEKNKLPKVIITTFTRKATQEVKERLLVQAMSFSDQELFNYINKKSAVHISTIHGVLSLLLAKNHDLLGLSSDIKICDAKALYKTYYRQLKSIFKSDSEYFELLEHYAFKDLVNLVIRFHEIQNQQPLQFVDQNILLKLRNDKCKSAIKDLNTILLIKDEIQSHKQWNPFFEYIDTVHQCLGSPDIDFNKLQNLFEAKPKKPSFFEAKPAFDSSVHDLIKSYFSSESDFIETIDTDDFINNHQLINQQFHKLALVFHQNVSQDKLKSGQISISDLESFSLQLIQKYPDQVKTFSDQYDYFMVDEYQDTSPLQVAILNSLIGNKSQFIVGDPQQSIYLFRGARSEVFLKKESEASQKNHELIQLQTNYRSDSKLMNCLNDITTTFSKQFQPMRPKDQLETEYNNQAYYIKCDDDYAGLAHHIQTLNKSGVPFGEICILFTKNSDIFDFAKFAIKKNIPVQSQIAAGFDKKREIIDLAAFLKFLVNPHDNLNLHILLRSPWFKMSDSEIFQIRQSDAKTSFWTQIKNQKPADFKNLSGYLNGYKQNGVLSALENFILDSQFLENSLLLDPTGKREANIYKFISNLKESLRQDQFILNDYLSAQFSSFQDDLSSNLNESMPLFSGNRVSIMTIHGSKGLQFKHVLLAGLCAKPKQTNQLQFIVDAESGLYSIPVLNSETKLCWSAWGKNQKIALNEKEQLEYERLFYVGITRAEKSISFMADMAKTPATGSWYTKMQWPTDGIHQLNGYYVTAASYSTDVDPIEAQSQPISHLKEKLNFEAGHHIEIDIPKISITDLISTDKNAVSEKQISEQTQNEKMIESLNKAQKGTDLHRLFEATKYLSREAVSTKATVEDQKALTWLFNLVEIPFQKILNEGHAEWGFGLKTKLGTLQGQIDLWAKIKEGSLAKVYVLDYKTGSSFFSEKALTQLERYSECLKKMNFISIDDEVELVVLYPFEEKIVTKSMAYKKILEI